MRFVRSWLLVTVGVLLSSLLAFAADEPPGDASKDALNPSAVESADGSDKPEEPADGPDPGDKAAPGDTPRRENAKSSSEHPTPSKSTRNDDDEYYEFYRTLADTIDQVERNYVKPVDRRELMEAAIRGVLLKLDPYSGYIDQEEMHGFRTSVESQFGGIGIQITIEDGQLKVTSPLVGTPAYKAGVQAGDRILEIEGESTKNLALDQAVRKLKGEVGTSVTFTVQHALTGRTETFTIKREHVHIDTVLGDRRKADDTWDYLLDPEKRIGYIRITAFSRDTAAEVRKALESLETRKLRGLILDLRFNPGGLLTSAIEVSDLFVADGRIVSTKGRNTEQRVWDAVKPGTFEGFPMVVLVNRYSASASEIVAACLQDHGRAVAIGERTWGKGSVQNVIELESGKSALKLTTASYARPNGHNIHRFPGAKESDEWGVKPNDGLEVKLSSNEMLRLLDYRRKGDIVQARKSDGEASAKSESKPSDDSPQEDADGEKNMSKSDAVKPMDDSKEKPDKSDVLEKAPDASDTTADEDNNSSRRNGLARFVDRQLQKAVEYLTSELARAQ